MRARGVLTHLVAFGLGAAAWHMARPAKKPVVVSSPVASAQRADGWPDAFQTLGIRSGDIILSVDDKGDQNTMLHRLVEGVEKGDVCVKLKRNERERKICLRASTGPPSAEPGAAVDLSDAAG